jgi:hypothetical protein
MYFWADPTVTPFALMATARLLVAPVELVPKFASSSMAVPPPAQRTARVPKSAFELHFCALPTVVPLELIPKA